VCEGNEELMSREHCSACESPRASGLVSRRYDDRESTMPSHRFEVSEMIRPRLGTRAGKDTAAGKTCFRPVACGSGMKSAWARKTLISSTGRD